MRGQRSRQESDAENTNRRGPILSLTNAFAWSLGRKQGKKAKKMGDRI